VYAIRRRRHPGFMTILWIASLILRNSSIVDIFWGAGFVRRQLGVFCAHPAMACPPASG